MASDQRSFFGYEPHWFTFDRLYVICLAAGSITGLRVGGQVYSSQRSTLAEDPSFYAKRELLVQYGTQAPWAVDLAFQDPKNFQIPVSQVASADFRTRRSLWLGPIPNSGVVKFRLRDGKRRRFILIGRQQAREVHASLMWAGVPVNTKLNDAPAS